MLLCGQIMPKKEAKNKQNKEIVENTERGKEKQGGREEGREKDRDKTESW